MKHSWSIGIDIQIGRRGVLQRCEKCGEFRVAYATGWNVRIGGQRKHFDYLYWSNGERSGNAGTCDGSNPRGELCP